MNKYNGTHNKMTQFAEDIKQIKTIFCLIYKYKVYIIGLLLITISIVVSTLFQPYCMGKIIDLLTYKESISKVSNYIILLFWVMLLNTFLTAIEGFLLSYISFGIENEVKKKVLEGFLNLRSDNNKMEKGGAIVEKVEQDAKIFPNVILHLVCGAVSDLLTVLIYLVILLNINFKMTMVLLIMYPILGIINFYYGKILRKFNGIFKEQKDRYINQINEIIHGKQTILNYSAEQYFLEKHENLLEYLFSTKISAAIKKIFNSFWGTITNSGFYIILLIMGIYQIYMNNLTLGIFLTFMSYSTEFSSAIISLTQLNVKVQEALVSIGRINDIIIQSQTTKFNKEVQINKDTHVIEIRNLSFCYGKKRIFKDLNFSFNAGKLYTIIGKSGTGKSTFLEILKGNIKNYAGEILIDEINIKELSSEFINDIITMVSQKDVLFSDTIKKNIIFNSQIEDRKIINACKLACINEEIEGLPKQYQTELGVDIRALSKGQQQRMLIARALIGETPIYLFDEVTASLDEENEMGIVNLMRKLAEKYIVIAVSHREKTIKHSDVVLEIKNGKLKVIYEGLKD